MLESKIVLSKSVCSSRLRVRISFELRLVDLHRGLGAEKVALVRGAAVSPKACFRGQHC